MKPDYYFFGWFSCKWQACVCQTGGSLLLAVDCQGNTFFRSRASASGDLFCWGEGWLCEQPLAQTWSGEVSLISAFLDSLVVYWNPGIMFLDRLLWLSKRSAVQIRVLAMQKFVASAVERRSVCHLRVNWSLVPLSYLLMNPQLVDAYSVWF